MVLLFILGVLLLGAGVAIIYGSVTANRPAPADTVGQIESYGFAAQPAAVGDGQSEPRSRPLGGLAARLGGFMQSTLGVGERGVRADLLAAGMYQTDPLTIVGYRVLGAAGGVALWIWI